MPNRYTPEELLFALQVREFANNIRKSHAPGDLWGSDSPQTGMPGSFCF